MEENTYSADFQRLYNVVVYTNKSVVEFAKSIGRNTTFYYDIKNNRPKRDKINKGIARDIIMAYPEISIDWLLNGTGEMLKPSKTRNIATASNNSTAVAGNNNVIDSNQNIASLIAIIKEKDDIIKKKDELIEKLISQLNQNS